MISVPHGKCEYGIGIELIASGMRTIYIHRDTEDPLEDEDALKSEFDLYIDGRAAAGHDGGLVHLAKLLSTLRSTR